MGRPHAPAAAAVEAVDAQHARRRRQVSRFTKGGRVYPAKPLAGIWATAPYLNNGSVANIWDLLTPPETRPRQFHARLAGIRHREARLRRRRRTRSRRRRRGNSTRASRRNSNTGHVYGTKLPDDDKWALIEFLKALRPGDIRKEPLRSGS